VPITARTVIERDSLFRGLPAATLERVAALAVRRICEDGSVIFLQGDPGDALCGVVSGRVRISASRPGGKEIFLNVIGPGETFGEIALLDGMTRTATATAVGRTELLVIPREAFLALLHAEPQLALHMIRLLCKRVRWTAEQVEDSALLSVAPRLAKRLLGLARQQGRETPAGTALHLSQEELAQFLGISRQAVNQYLQSWKRRGWIRLGRGTLVIGDRRALQNLSRES
jgi:CRP-like cAMP-binding protein